MIRLSSWLRALLRLSRRTRPATPRRTPSRRLLGEVLEDRVMPASGPHIYPVHPPALVSHPTAGTDSPPEGSGGWVSDGYHLVYARGAVLAHVQIQPIFLQDATTHAETAPAFRAALHDYFSDITSGPYIPTLLSQYSVHGHAIGTGSVAADDVHVRIASSLTKINGKNYRAVNASVIRHTIELEVRAHHIAAPGPNTLYMVFPPPGDVETDSQVGNSVNDFLGYHDSFGKGKHPYYFAIIPDQTPKGPNANEAYLGFSAFQGETDVASHELSEAITDPAPFSGWTDPYGGEVGDIAQYDYTQDGYVVQNEWSNVLDQAAHAVGTKGVDLYINQLAPPALTSFPGGPVATFTDTDLHLKASDFKVTVDFGDGNGPLHGFVTGGANGVYVVSATPATPLLAGGSYNMQVFVRCKAADGANHDKPLTYLDAGYTVSRSGPLTYTADSGSGAHHFALHMHGPYLVLADNGQPVFTQLAARTTSIAIAAAPVVPGDRHGSVDNSLTLDYSRGTFSTPVAFDGGPGSGAHTLTLSGGHFGSETFSSTNRAAGTVWLDTQDITFSRLRGPVTDSAGAATFTVQGTSGSDTVDVQAGPMLGGAPTMEVTSGAHHRFATVVFTNKARVNLDGLGGNDHYRVTQSALPPAGLTIGDSGPGGASTLTVLSTASGPETIGVTDTQVTRSHGGPVRFAGISRLTVTGHSGGDVFNVTPSQTLPITVQGSSPGEVLNYLNLLGGAVSKAPAGSSGTIHAAGLMPVTYRDMAHVTLNAPAGLLAFSAPAGTDNAFVLRQGGSGNLEVLDNGAVVASLPMAQAQQVRIVGAAGQSNSLLIDYSAGSFTQDVAFDGGQGSHSSLTLQGESVLAQTFEQGSSSLGLVDLDGQTIRWANLSAIASTVSAGQVLFSQGPGQTLTLSAGAAPGQTTLTSGGLTTTFMDPTALLSLTGSSGGDRALVQGLGQGFAAGLHIALTGGGDDVAIGTPLALGKGSVTGDLFLQAETIHLNAATIDTSGGPGGGQVTLLGAVTLGTSLTISTGGGAVNLGRSPIDGANYGQETLTIRSGPGSVTLGAVGTTSQLVGLTVITTGQLTLDGDLRTEPDLSGPGVVDLHGATGGILLGNSITISSDADAVGVGGQVNLNTTLDAAKAGLQTLTVSAGSGQVILGTLGATTPLGGLSVTGGVTQLEGNISTDRGTGTGAVDLSGVFPGIVLDTSVTIDTDANGDGKGGSLNLNTSINSATLGGGSLTGVPGNGAVTLGTVGGKRALGQVDFSAATGPVTLEGDITTYGGPISSTYVYFGKSTMLARSVTVNTDIDGYGGNVGFGGLDATTAGVQGLTVEAGLNGSAQLGQVGQTPLSSLTVSGNSVSVTGTITTTGNVDLTSFQGTVEVAASITTTSGDVAVRVGGGYNVIVDPSVMVSAPAGKVVLEGGTLVALQAGSVLSARDSVSLVGAFVDPPAVGGPSASVDVSGSVKAPVLTIATGETQVALQVNVAAMTGPQRPRLVTITAASAATPNLLTYDAGGQPVLGQPGGFVVGTATQVRLLHIQTMSLNDAASVNALAGPDTADRATAFQGLSASERFVQALYLDILGRAGTQKELDTWLGQLAGANGQQQVAQAIEGSAEARARLVKSWYETFLGRRPTSAEQAGAVAQLRGSGGPARTEEQVLAGVLASPAFYQHAQALLARGTADQRFVKALYRLLLGRSASGREVALWLGQLPALGRQGVALALLGGVEYRTDQVAGYYEALLHQPADPAALSGWVASGQSLFAIRVAMEAGPQFFFFG